MMDKTFGLYHTAAYPKSGGKALRFPQNRVPRSQVLLPLPSKRPAGCVFKSKSRRILRIFQSASNTVYIDSIVFHLFHKSISHTPNSVPGCAFTVFRNSIPTFLYRFWAGILSSAVWTPNLRKPFSFTNFSENSPA